MPPPTAAGALSRDGERNGWQEQESGTEEDLRSVSAVDHNTAWAVGAAGTVLRTTDGGTTWKTLDAGVTSQLNAVSAVSVDEAWVGGEGGNLLHTEDGGKTWEAAMIPESSTVHDIAALDDKTCWVAGATGVGSGGFIMKTADDGGTWEHQVSGHAYAIFSISAVDDLTAWAAGGESPFQGNAGVVLRTTDGGKNWAPAGPADKNWLCIAACDGQNAMAWGVFRVYDGFPPMFAPCCMKTADGGSSWQNPNLFYTLECSMTAYPGGAIMFDANDIWMVGGNANPNVKIARTENGGLSWCQQQTIPTDVVMLDISAVDGDIAWAVGTSGTILHTTSGGYLGEDPVLDTLSPDTGRDGETVTLTGSGFGTSSAHGFVTFGLLRAGIVSWSENEIVCAAPAIGSPFAQVSVYVTTPGGTSDPLVFTYKNIALSVESIYPTRGYQFNPFHNVTVTGTGFLPGARVMLVKGSTVINASNVNVMTQERIHCTLNLMGAAPGLYDVVVSNPDGTESWLNGGFTVVSPCGSGSGTALLMLGISLGILSLAGSRRLRRPKGRRGRD
ncbi:MAG: IPT/TIG domain-containing protein [Actinobacteria bacterium]|nr:IPT/TIG domain-containing protein [Actinomycetota bacterium]